jgi:hypothetical protein
MFDETAVVGPTTFPVEAGAARSSLTDPIALGLAEYLAHWLNTDLNAQLAVMTGHTATAVPSGKQYGYDPQGAWVRNTSTLGSKTTPAAIYVWWQSSADGQWSTLKDSAISTYGFFWVFDELVAHAGSQHLAGIQKQAERVLRRAADRGYHPTYSYDGADLGTPIGVSLGMQWRFKRLESGAMVPVPATSTAVGGAGEGGITRFIPCVQGQIEVLEIVGQQIPRDPEDVLFDVTLELRTNEAGDVTDAVEIMERYLPAPDGSEQP